MKRSAAFKHLISLRLGSVVLELWQQLQSADISVLLIGKSIPRSLRSKDPWYTFSLFGAWLWLDLLPYYSSKMAALSSSLEKAMCLYKVESNSAYSASILCCFITTPLIIISVCYVKVFRTVSRSNRVFSLENNSELLRVNVQEAKVTKRLVAVMVGFACYWLPIAIIDNIDIAHGEPILPRLAYLTYGFLLYLSSTINPFIYCATDKRFRREYKAVFWKSFGFKCRANNENNDA